MFQVSQFDRNSQLCGELRLAHDGELFHEAEPAAVGGGVVVGVGGQGLPLDVERVVAILEAPDMTSQTGVDQPNWC